ncbi:hypothetical protein FEM48_Zijuj12G0064200 [Ziziphus jujuba var. spinosa]|uniref:AB hydrolase-1 domain-containing protein n=1 Tax=Ziziphus jujuba var. spinosa TaxID=714518 RepID=A0A978UBP8_ZIZJJ|nr:hypothetical protein FEM48_Zijuj12G0064200 [Ziziphus jujuba var. spinosa]
MAASCLYSYCFHRKLDCVKSETLILRATTSYGNHRRISISTRTSSRSRILCSSARDSSEGDNIPSNFCIIEGPETVQDFVQMQSQEIEDNIRSRRNKIFLLMEEVRRLRIQQRLKGIKVIDEAGEEDPNEMPDIPSSIPFLNHMTPRELKKLYLTSLSFVSGIIVFGGLIAPTLELKLGLGGTSYEDFIRNMHLPMQLSQVDPIVASFSGGAVGVISALMIIEANNVEQQEKKRCKYCLGTGYLACARCSASGVCMSINPISVASASDHPLRVGTTQRCPNCSGAGKHGRKEPHSNVRAVAMAGSLLRKKSGLNPLLLTRFLSSPPVPAFYGNGRTRRSLATLAFEEVRTSTEKPYVYTAFVLHGLLGSGRNWRSFSRHLLPLLSNSSDWRMVLVDLRNHGKSAEIEGLSPPHDLTNAAQDLANLVKSQGWAWPDVVIGHSLGGKVTLQFAESCARGHYGESAALPKQIRNNEDDEQLWVLDSVPGEVKTESSDGEVEKVLQTLQGLPLIVPSRKVQANLTFVLLRNITGLVAWHLKPKIASRWLVNHMMGLGFSKSLSDWIGSNLKKSGDQETWAFNLDGAVQMFNSYREMSYWTLLEHPPKGMEIDIVRAEKSDRWDPETVQRLESLASREQGDFEGKVAFHILPEAGHWVHVDNPKGLLEIVGPKIAAL